MLERFFKSQVATVSDSTYCHRITDALTAAGIKCYRIVAERERENAYRKGHDRGMSRYPLQHQFLCKS